MSSFTMMIKDEICQKSFQDCCQKSLLSAFIRLNHLTNNNQQKQEIKLYSFHKSTINLVFQLLKNQGLENYSQILTKKYKKIKKYLIEVNHLSNDVWLKNTNFDILNKNVKKHCLRAYIAGIFLGSGSINSPTTSNYHLELQFGDCQFAKTIQKLLLDNFNLDFKIIIRRKKIILYLKKSNDISEFLKLLDCPQAVFSFEDQRIKRELLNTINRFNNIDISNQQKTLLASLQQVKMITKIKDLNGFNQLSDKCQILADLRLKNQDASLTELSIFYYEKTGEVITKSGINHLMRELGKTYRELLSI